MAKTIVLRFFPLSVYRHRFASFAFILLPSTSTIDSPSHRIAIKTAGCFYSNHHGV